ncbi:MAG: dephospho-CoA kinase [Treponema sp.]|jgi:dephospho-CoA kinase|nr:dephospho-CoA kinase [Treponema sp.]
MLIGLTGMYCAGKNHVAGLLEARGLPVLDVDKLGHAAIDAEKEAIFSRFGDLRQADGTVDRSRLGKKVFGKPAELAALEGIVHPAANRLTDEWIAARRGQSCVINAALLHRSSALEKLDCVLLVEAPFFTRLRRARLRDGLSWIALLRRFASQRNFKAQYLAGKADIYRVENPDFTWKGESPAAALERRIDGILSGLNKKHGA